MPQTTDLHEIRSVATEVPVGMPRVWPLQLSFLPCNCQHCIVDNAYHPMNTQCKMRHWRNMVSYNAKIGGVTHNEASSFEGEMICTEKQGVVRTGVIVQYVQPQRQEDAQKWCVRFGDDPVEWFKFVDICNAMTLFKKKQQQLHV